MASSSCGVVYRRSSLRPPSRLRCLKARGWCSGKEGWNAGGLTRGLQLPGHRLPSTTRPSPPPGEEVEEGKEGEEGEEGVKGKKGEERVDGVDGDGGGGEEKDEARKCRRSQILPVPGRILDSFLKSLSVIQSRLLWSARTTLSPSIPPRFLNSQLRRDRYGASPRRAHHGARGPPRSEPATERAPKILDFFLLSLSKHNPPKPLLPARGSCSDFALNSKRGPMMPSHTSGREHL